MDTRSSKERLRKTDTPIEVAELQDERAGGLSSLSPLFFPPAVSSEIFSFHRNSP
jgi:hypothetical protein